MAVNVAGGWIGVVSGVLLAGACSASDAPAEIVYRPLLWPSAASPVRDPKVEELVESLLARLSLEEKVGQMIQADIAAITPAELREYKLGSILAGGNAAPGGDVRTTPQAWADLTDQFHRAALGASVSGHPAIPILFGIDAVHGNAKLVGATIFPHNVGLGAAHDPDLLARIGAVTAAEVAAIGVDWAFAPTVAVVRDVRWGRSYESYSEDPQLVQRYAPAMVSGLQGRCGTSDFMAPGHVLSSVKHFLGDGGTTAGRDQGDTVVSESELSAVHGAGYPPAIRAGALIVMASYNSWNGTKLHANRYLLTDILKGRLGFGGFVVGDWNAHEQIPGCSKYDCAAAINSGLDMLMAPDGWREAYRNTLTEARSGMISQSRIDDAVRRILRVKVIAGLFAPAGAVSGSGSPDRFAVIGSAEHRAIAREAVRKSLVLLKNDGAVLPLNPAAHVVVAGRGADDVGIQSGGWTVDWQGDHNSAGDFPGATSIYAGIEAAVAAHGGSAELRPDGHFVSRPDVAIVVFGEGPYAEFQGDRETLQFSPQDRGDLALLRRFKAQGIRTVSVFLSGRPLWVNPELNASDAFVAAWLPGSEGEGLADVLFASSAGQPAYDFTGRLGFSWPGTAMPVRFGATGEVSGALFARGFGLDYGSSVRPPSRDARMRDLDVDPHVDAHFSAPAGSLFHAGHATAPWSLFVADGTDEVHVTTARQESPRAALSVVLGEGGLEAAWNGSGAGMLRIEGRARSLQDDSRQPVAIRLRYRVDVAPAGAVRLGMLCTQPLCGTARGATLDLGSVFARSSPGTWHTLTVPIACLKSLGAELSSVEVPFALSSAGRFGLTITEVGLIRSGAQKPSCPPV